MSDDIPVEALRFLLKVDRMTLGAVQFAQHVHDLTNDVHMMTESSADPATEDAEEELGKALAALDQAIGQVEVGFESEFDSYLSMERSRDTAEASAQALDACLEALEALGEYDPEA